ncbi:heavy-metal-associated domain-containing protein [Corynebacterium anserum]|uniref:Heavy metal transporter n=1 Tax=Corynebacterium anserum TaxID=2684406 RepID=A0A7G7YMG8_9CORY|nr:heavy-metal-associated domain-containing protein [Corynebacterium anserum]MBC2681054.1 heavy metal transporter [Corynebacterium anserum]QNH95688.1 heavy metal transporter [Corynebacterium anserum]
MSTENYIVEGMSCGHCEAAVTQEMQKLAGVSDIQVSASSGTLSFQSDGTVAEADVIAAVDEAGFDATRA